MMILFDRYMPTLAIYDPLLIFLVVVMFSLIGATLQGANPEFVGTEIQSFDPTIAPVGKIVCISCKLIPTVEEITSELRQTIKKRDDLKARLLQVPGGC